MLKLQSVKGNLVMITSGLALGAKASAVSTSLSNTIVLIVNTIGIKKNIHLYIESMLSKYLIKSV